VESSEESTRWTTQADRRVARQVWNPSIRHQDPQGPYLAAELAQFQLEGAACADCDQQGLPSHCVEINSCTGKWGCIDTTCTAGRPLIASLLPLKPVNSFKVH